MDQIIKTISALECVEKVSPWNDRFYINLQAARGSRANADLRTKIWLKGTTLTIETGKGYHSDAFRSQRDELISTVQAAGGSIHK